MSNDDFDIRPPGWTNLDEVRVINIKVRDVDAAYRKSSYGHIKAIKLMVAGALVMSCAAFFMVAL